MPALTPTPHAPTDPAPRTAGARPVCVKGRSVTDEWSGTPRHELFTRICSDTTVRDVRFERAHEGIDMATGTRPRTLMGFRRADEFLPTHFGYPVKIRTPTKLDFKDPEIVTIFCVTNEGPRGFWTDRRYNWFSGI